MRFAYWYLPLYAAFCLASASCSTQADSYQKVAPPPIPPPESPSVRVSFDYEGVLELTPGDSFTLTVETAPPGMYDLRFALLGEPLDASLDKATATTGADGRADVTLKTPNTTTTFRVLASIDGGTSDEIDVNIKEQGLGSIRVVPTYAGSRTVTTWSASAYSGTNCKALAGLLPDKNEPTVKASSPGDAFPVLENVPVGPNVAVVLYSAHSMWGCADESHLKAGQQIETTVNVIDQPLNLGATDLDLKIAFNPMDEAYAAIMKDTSNKLANALFPELIADVPAVILNAMETALAPEHLDAFQQERALSAWDQKTLDHLLSLPIDPRTQILTWLDEALNPTVNPAAPLPEIQGQLVPAGNVPGKAWFHPLKTHGIDAAQAGFPATHLMDWNKDAGDTVLFSGTLFWIPTFFAGSIAFARAQQSYPSAQSMGEILSSSVLNCPALATALGSSATCDTACLQSTCEQAIAAMWQQSLGLSGSLSTAGYLKLIASAHTLVNDEATPIAFEGKWLGTFSNGSLESNLGGIISGLAPQDPPPAP